MKHFLAFIFLFFSCLICFSQEAIVSLTRENKVYIGIDNPMTVMAENIPCKSIFLRTDNLTIEKDPASKNDCDYYIQPEKEGSAKIYVCRLYQNDTVVIDSFYFRAKRIPDPEPMIANKKGGYINKNTLAAQPALFAVLEGFGFDLKFSITGFTILIHRTDREIFFKKVEGCLLTKEIKAAIMQTEKNDKVWFLDILSAGPDGKSRILMPMEFIIE